MDIIRELRDARQTANLTQGALGERLGITQAHLSDIEKGKVTPRLSTVVEIARTLDREVIVVPRNKLRLIETLLSGKSATPLWDLGEPDEEE